jgi:hypothetical protein
LEIIKDEEAVLGVEWPFATGIGENDIKITQDATAE